MQINSSLISVFAGQGLGALGSLATLSIATHYFRPDEYGVFILILSTAGFIEAFPSTTAQALCRYSAQASKTETFAEFLNSIRSTQLKLWAITAFAVVIFSATLFFFKHSHIAWIPIISFTVALSSTHLVSLHAIAISLGRQHIISIQQIATPWSRICISIGLLQSANFSPILCFYIGHVAGSVIAALYYAIVLQINKSSVTAHNSTKWTEIVSLYLKPFYFWLVPSSLQPLADRWIIEFYCSTASVATYGLSFQLGFSPISQFFAAVRNVLMPKIFSTNSEREKQLDHQRIQKIAHLSIVFCAIFSLLVYLVIFPLMAPLFLHGSYLNISLCVALCIIAGGLFEATQTLSLILMMRERNELQIRPKILFAVIGLILSIIGAWFYGATGVSVALVVSNCIYFFLMSYSCKLSASTPHFKD